MIGLLLFNNWSFRTTITNKRLDDYGDKVVARIKYFA
jgi:hypothetical protein